MLIVIIEGIIYKGIRFSTIYYIFVSRVKYHLICPNARRMKLQEATARRMIEKNVPKLYVVSFLFINTKKRSIFDASYIRLWQGVLFFCMLLFDVI